MARNDFINGQPFNADKWNVFAISMHNLNQLSWDIHHQAYGTDVATSALGVDTKTSVDVLNGAVQQYIDTSAQIKLQIDDYIADFTPINPSISSPTSLGYTYTPLNAENITETETLSWFDSLMDLGNNILYTYEQYKLAGEYTPPSNLVDESGITLTLEERYYENFGSIRNNNLSKTYYYGGNRFVVVSQPDGEYLIDVTHETLTSTIDTNFDTSEQWEHKITNSLGVFTTTDNNYIYIYRPYTVNFYRSPGNDTQSKIYLSYIVTKIEMDGYIVSENQYNKQIYYKYVSSSNNSDINFDIRGNVKLQNQTRNCLIGLLYEIEENDDYKYNVSVYTFSGIMTSTGWSTTHQDVVHQRYDDDNDEDFDYYNFAISYIDRSDYQLITTVFSGREVQSDNDEIPYTWSFTHKYVGGSVTSYSFNDWNSSYDNESNNIYIVPYKNHHDGKLYIYSFTESSYSQSGPDPYYQHHHILEVGENGYNTIKSYTLSGSTTHDYSVSGIKITPNYYTNSADVFWIFADRNRDTGVTTYTYNKNGTEISKNVYDLVVPRTTYTYNGNICEGLSVYGEKYSYATFEDAPSIYLTNLLAEYQNNIEYSIMDKTFTIYQILPLSRTIATINYSTKQNYY